MPRNSYTRLLPAGAPNTSWAARFGQVILAHGVATLPQALFTYQGRLHLSAQEVWFISYILAHKWDATLPHPSLKQMAANTGMSLSQLKRIRADLCTRAYLQIQERFGVQGDQAPNSYDFAGLFARLEAAIAGEPVPDNPIQVERPTLNLAPDPPQETTFVARYGRVIAQAGIIAIPQALFLRQAELRLTPQQVWFVCYILAHRWSTELPHPSLVRMAERTGYSQRQLHNIKDTLVEQGYLRLMPRRAADGGKDTNAYDFGELLATVDRLLRQAAPVPPAVSVPAPLEPVPARRGRRRAAAANDPPSPALDQAPRIAGGVRLVPVEGGAFSSNGRGASSSDRGGAFSSDEGGHPTSYPGGTFSSDGGVSPVPKGGAFAAQAGGAQNTEGRGAPGADKEEPNQTEPNQANDSNRHSASTTRGNDLLSDPRGASVIAGVIMDFSRELGDTPHEAANVTQALRLWSQTHLDPQSYVELLYEARRRTRQYQGRQGTGAIDNRMAYFFRVLRDLSIA